MYRSSILYSLIKIPFDLIIVFCSFLIAGIIRSNTDLIPKVQLPIQTIPLEALLIFAVIGSLLWVFLFYTRGLYRVTPDTPLSEEVSSLTARVFGWFFIFIGIVYLSAGFIITYDIPRLVILFAAIISFISAILLRISIYGVYLLLSRYHYIRKQKILIISDKEEAVYKETAFLEYQYLDEEDSESIKLLIRERKIDALLSLGEERKNEKIRSYIELCKIYGIRFAYPKIDKSTEHIPQKEGFIGKMPVMEASSVTIEPMERVAKRLMDIIGSSVGIIILSPLFVIIALAIKLDDPSGPIIYKNRRIGLSGKEFFLWKFRYMYWKYSIKDSYGIEANKDEALAYEESLKEKNNTRNGPLYKIKDDPRKTKVGKYIERLSLDELPQLFNVIKGDMSLIGPRPHQPREVESYEEYQYQVLTIKPGITGMAQVHGREKNNFAEEVALDTYYIEHYSLGLDITILLRTIGVVLTRAFSRE